MAEQKTASKVVASLGFTGYNVRFSFPFCSLAPYIPFSPCPSLSLFLSLSLSLKLTHRNFSLPLILSICLPCLRSFAHTLPPYFYLARSHLVVAGLDMLSWDTAAGLARNAAWARPLGLPRTTLIVQIRRSESRTLKHNFVRHTQCTIIPSSALGCSRPPPISA